MRKCTISKQPLRNVISDLGNRYPCDENKRLLGLRDLQQARSSLPRGENGLPDPNDPMLLFIAGQHSITQQKFENIVGEYFFPNQVPAPEVRSLAQIDDLIVAAADNKIQFTYDEWERTSNDIEITAVKGAVPIYSAYLFLGIKLLHQNQIKEFHFYRAIDEQVFTVAIAAIGNNNNILYLGELSELFP